jgi:hypothetical protein
VSGFIRTEKGALSLDSIQEFMIYPGDETDTPEIMALLKQRDKDGLEDFVLVLDCCCMDSAHAALEKLLHNIARNRHLDHFEVDCQRRP